MKCDNCDNDAVYVFADPGSGAVSFCSVHVPEFLLHRIPLGAMMVVSTDDATGDSTVAPAEIAVLTTLPDDSTVLTVGGVVTEIDGEPV